MRCSRGRSGGQPGGSVRRIRRHKVTRSRARVGCPTRRCSRRACPSLCSPWRPQLIAGTLAREMPQHDRVTLKAQLKQVRRILWVDWDPIGVNDSPEAYGEYDSYADSVLGMILHGTTAEELNFYLGEIETDSMSLGSSPAPASSRSIAISKLLAITSGTAPPNHDGPDVLAMVTLLPAAAGGKVTHSGYRPQHRLLGDYQTSGVHDYVGCSTLNPGESAEATISFLEPFAYLRSVTKGDIIEISEGSRVVGHATIVAVLNPVLERAG